MSMMKKMIVVGGGPAGMMAAIQASQFYDVTLLEKNEKLGKKLFITGKGRCNLTNECDIDAYLKHTVSNPKFMYSAIHAFTCQDTIETFRRMGLKVKTERGNRVFPASDHSSDVIGALVRELEKRHVDVQFHRTVTDICTEEYPETDGISYVKQVTGVKCKKEFFPADVVVLATGGLSYPSTGSTGDGIRWAEKLGLAVVPPEPALVPINIKEDFCKRMMGLSLRNVNVRFLLPKSESSGRKKDKIIYEDFGEMIFTHFGVSGPVILSASSYLHKYLRENEEIRLEIDLKPALTEQQLDERLRKDFEKYSNKQFQNSLNDLLPRMMIPVLIERTGIEPYKRVNEIRHEERMKIIKYMKCFSLHVAGLRGFDEAIITKGGVAVKEINPKTMEAKKIKGLRFAGEMIDVDTLTGGFNLQTAWSTGYAAGQDEQ